MKSRICTQATLELPSFQKWAAIFGNKGHMHRKIWEWAFVCDALERGGYLARNRSGLGFAVGEETLPALFASRGCNILATDLDSDSAAESGWVETNQHANNKSSLNKKGLCDEKFFDEHVDFKFVNMKDIPKSLDGKFDFTWSSCAFEHLGSIDAGIDFVLHSLSVLKPGGIAIHTTEYNVSSNDLTVESGETVIYRKRDIERLQSAATAQGYQVDVDYNCGSGPYDYYVDVPPYKDNPHLKLRINDFIVTSIGLIFYKPL
jgi:SAM-dependent methyltransferase